MSAHHPFAGTFAPLLRSYDSLVFRADLIRLHLACSRRKPWRMRILFSTHPDLEHAIRHGMKHTPHEIHFSDIRPEILSDYDLIVPLRVDQIRALNDYRPLLLQNPIPLPSLESVELCDDKWCFNAHLLQSRFAELIPRLDVIKPPFILKKRVDERGINTHVIDNDSAMDSFAKEIAGQAFFTQELIEGDREYATHLIQRDGKALCSISLEYRFDTTKPIKGKDAPRVLRRVACPWIEEFSAVLRHTGFEGLCCVNYKIQAGRPKIFEINPRFGGTLPPFFFAFLPALQTGRLHLEPAARQVISHRESPRA